LSSIASACNRFSRVFSSSSALTEWASLKAYPTSDRRAEELAIWLHRYNWHRPHGGIKSQTPISKLGLKNNLLGLRT